MKHISVPYHLIIPSIISILILATIFYKRKKTFKTDKRKWLWTCISLFFIIYLLIVGGATYVGISSELNLQKFDLNRDGFFSGNEITPELKKALRKVTSDTGRNFSFISGLFASGIISITIYFSGLFLKKIKAIKLDV